MPTTAEQERVNKIVHDRKKAWKPENPREYAEGRRRFASAIRRLGPDGLVRQQKERHESKVAAERAETIRGIEVSANDAARSFMPRLGGGASYAEAWDRAFLHFHGGNNGESQGS
jgi:hypothetical protein